MARSGKTGILASLADTPPTAELQADAENEEKPSEPEEEATPQGRKSSARRAPARKATRRQGAAVASSGSADTHEKGEADDEASDRREGPQVLKPDSTTAAARISLYVHPDDKRMLGLRKLDDGIDENSRIRALLALYRYDERLAKRTDRLARDFRNK